MSNPFQLTFTLKQHTPIIHFQHDQEGATLRATEVKPKLDRFIIQKMKEANIPMPDSWYNNKERESLDYKLIINGTKNETKTINKGMKFPCFFADMGDGYEGNEKGFVYTTELIKCNIISIHGDLNKYLSNKLNDFFSINNFGNRQSKGFGSFTINSIKHENEETQLSINSNLFRYHFDIDLSNKNLKIDDFRKPFEKLDWFYRSLRSGINYKGLYFKSSLFMYLNSKNIQWDKKTIKAHYLNHSDRTISEAKRNGNNWSNEDIPIIYRDSQNEKHKYPDILNNPELQNNELNLKLWRDLLGLSSEESWYSYRVGIFKGEAFFNTHSNKWELKKKDVLIDRFKSPILFKPVLSESKITIYFDVFDETYNTVFGKKMMISINHKDIKKFDKLENGKPKFKYDSSFRGNNKSDLVLPFPTTFDFKGYLDFVFKEIDPETHISIKNKRNEELKEIKDTLSKIYKKIKENLNSK